MTARRLLVAVAVVAAVAACDDGDAAPATTAVATTDVATTEPPETTDAPTTSSTTTTTTTSPSPTTSPEAALKAEIAADYERGFYRSYEMMVEPTIDDLDARVAEVFAPGSPSFDVFRGRIQELVELGDAVVPNEPDILTVIVENVELVGSEPFTRAEVTVCEVENRRQVTLPENSPNGQEIETLGSGDLLALRTVQDVRLTPNGWLPFESPPDAEAFPGVESCPLS